jgi:phospholipid/cholesterol/gamma-HCH transport system substrate-binding protein
MSKQRTAIVGAFVIGGLLLFAFALFLIGDRRLLFAEQFELFSTFGKVTGLEVGTRVMVAGLDAGEVLEILIPSRPSERFRVRMRLREDLRQLVRTDSVCAVQTDGIVGNAFIQVGTGSDQARAVASGDTIEGRDPIEFADLIEEGRATFRTVSAEIIDLKQDVSAAIDSLNATVLNANGILTDVGEDAKRLSAKGLTIVDDFGVTMSDVKGVVSDVRGGKGAIGQLLTDDTLYVRINEVADHLEKTAGNVQELTNRTRQAIETFTAADGAGTQLMNTVRDTMRQAEEMVSDLTESTEALKRNFLVRGFFRERGFFDLDTISREAYTQGALEVNRTALRIWFDVDALFTRSEDGGETLSDTGRRRLESAMVDFARYPRESALVVEGYAEDGRGLPRDLRAAARAEAVRDFLLGRYRRRTTLTGTMALDEAPQSPRGDGRWSGVALALFVRNEALAR